MLLVEAPIIHQEPALSPWVELARRKNPVTATQLILAVIVLSTQIRKLSAGGMVPVVAFDL